MIQYNRLLFISITTILLSTSCANMKKLEYLQGPLDSNELSKINIPDPVIQKGDVLNITVYSDNPTASAVYNQSMANLSSLVGAGSDGSNGSSQQSSVGYLVDNFGNIQFPGIGVLYIEGITKKQLSELLDNKLKPFLQNPYYNIRFLNYKITIIGDVAQPSVYSIPSERVNIFEAIALAGDLTITANRNNVLVIREQNGKREFGRLDLTNPEIFKSPFYHLKQNDIVYVDLTKHKAISNSETTLRYVTFGTSIISAIALILTIFRN